MRRWPSTWAIRRCRSVSTPPTGCCPRSPPTGSARSQGQGWPQATRKGSGLDRGEDDATITNRGHTQPRNDLQPTAQKCNDVPRHLSTVSRDITKELARGLEPLTTCLQEESKRAARCAPGRF